jgi:hypothetical protein
VCEELPRSYPEKVVDRVIEAANLTRVFVHGGSEKYYLGDFTSTHVM